MNNYFLKTERIKEVEFVNRICINPMEGSDANPDGTPGELTVRRYERFAKSSAGLLWFEAVSVCPEGRASANQLYITKENAGEYKKLVAKIKSIAPVCKVVCQLTHSGRFSRPDGTPKPYKAFADPYLDERFPAHKAFEPVSDTYLDTVPEMFLRAAELAKDAGFDGVDIKACHRYLLCELLAAHTREGKYGGSYENRTRLIRDIFEKVNKLADGKFLLCSRFGIYDAIAYPYGFGVAKNEITPDFSEPVRLLKELHGLGLSLINITMGTPYYNPHVNKPHKSPLLDGMESSSRLLSGAAYIKQQCKEIKTVSTGFSYLKDGAFKAGNELLESGGADFIGFGRLAFANSDFGTEILHGALDAKKCCISCNKCSDLLRRGAAAGCVIFDKDTYLPIYKKTVLEEKSNG